MAIIYTWQIKSLKTTTQEGYSDVVVDVVWVKTGTDENGRVGEYCDRVGFTIGPNQQNFIPFAQLTEAVVIGWVQTALSDVFTKSIDPYIERQIAERQYPVVDAPLPWVAS